MLFNININNFIKKIFILQILCLKILIAQENDYRANPEKDSQVSYMISTAISDKYMIVCADVRAAKAARKYRMQSRFKIHLLHLACTQIQSTLIEKQSHVVLLDCGAVYVTTSASRVTSSKSVLLRIR